MSDDDRAKRIAEMNHRFRMNFWVPCFDPHREHDIGAFDMAGEKIFWKIDYYDDEPCSFGSEDPADPARTFRVLTIMLASEY